MADISKIQIESGTYNIKDKVARNFINNQYFDILANGGYDDGETPNDNVFNTAKDNGIRKFYFPQNSNGNANYYFTNYAFFNDCEVKTDEGVIINFPNISNIDSSKTGKYITNMLYYSRVQNNNFLTPSNISDYFNHFNMKNYKRKINQNSLKTLSNLKLYLFNYENTGLFEDADSSKSDCFQEIDYNIRYKANAYTSILCTPINHEKYECIEIETTPGTQIYFGWVNSTTLGGVLNDYDGENPQNYYSVDGTPNSTKTNVYTRLANFWNHYLKNTGSNDYNKSMKYKLKNNPILKQVELFINDIFVCAYPYNTTDIDYMGFGIKTVMGTSSSNGFSYISTYEEEVTPLNTSLNILLVGDSRTYGFNSQYKIEEVIKCGLISNGINNVNIKNISVSGYTISNIITALGEETLSNYDIVITATGINDYTATYKSILEAIFSINQTITNAHCYSLMCATIPACYGGTDPLGNARAEMYYKIENAIFNGCLYNNREGLVKYIPNVMGNTNSENLLPVCNDGVHPTTVGSIQFAKAIVNEILTLFN